FTAPAAGATLTGTHSFNATINDNVTTVQTVIFQFSNRSGTAPFNRTASNSSGTWNVSVDTTTITEGALTVTVFANDTVGNMNSTQTLSLTVDNVAEGGTQNAGSSSAGGGGGGGSTAPTPKAVCQNGIIENGEQCDSGEGCLASCECGDGYKSLKKIDCERLPYCGDGVVNRFTEQCDITDLNGQTCSLIGYADGELRCTPQCTFDVSECVSPEGALKEPEIEKGKAKEALVTTKHFLQETVEGMLQSAFMKKSAALISAIAAKIVGSIKNYLLYWLLPIAVILILIVGLYVKDRPLPEFLWKMKAAPQVRVEQAPATITPSTTIGKPDIHLRDWGKKNYLDLRQELKHVEALIKETPLPEQKNKALKLTSLRAMKTEQKQPLKNPATKQQNLAQTFEEVEQWVIHLFASGTPAHKVAAIIKNATLLSDTEIKTGLIKVRARHLLEKRYSLNQKALAELQEFIRTERKRGATTEQIVADLAREGWDKEIIRLYVSAYYY
ncbi:MAG: Ig-like domain-containing protein, partial [Nanoarchaeota archaeon]|nr:Ig-like domain-containing protein [Nanoarchaeota archaeon]